MNVAIIGSGGREHALAFKVAESNSLGKLFVIPGNPGTAELGENIDLKLTDRRSIVSFCMDNKVDLVVIGPEQPLMDGLADALRNENIKVFGPDSKAAIIEGEKSFAKDLMNKYAIPTAPYEIFDKLHHKEALSYLNKCSYPLVIKADGLAAGKGVAICGSFEEAEKTLKDYFSNAKFGAAGEKVVIEEFLSGEEASIFVVTDGKEYIILPPSQDHKKIFDGDLGKNTGGMGAYAPAPLIDADMLEKIENRIIKPTVDAMERENRRYSGCLYIGIIVTANGPQVIEYNCRFGDPETQAVLPVLEGDFLELLFSTASGSINKEAVQYNGGSALCVIAASKGYPDIYEKGFEITGLDTISVSEAIVFHAGTKMLNGKLITDGGRVLGVTAYLRKNSIKDCKTIAYTNISKVNYKGIYYRKDIGSKAFK